jgi:hypothetical protein
MVKYAAKKKKKKKKKNIYIYISNNSLQEKKSLGPLVKQIKEEHLLYIIDCLGEYASQKKNDELRGIASIGKV